MLKKILLLVCLSVAFLPLLPIARADVASDQDMTKTDFKFNVNDLSPGQDKYADGAKVNLKTILSKVGTTLLIVIPMLAVLFMVIGGIMMATAHTDSGQFGKGKTVIQFNIIALVLSLLSYSIIQLVAWVLQIR